MADTLDIPWWQKLPIHGWRIVTVVESADEIPRYLPRNGVVLVGSRTPKWIAFDCPCRSGHRIMLNTDKARWPYWSVTLQGRLTIYPSIDYRGPEGRCHFILRNGRIQWTYGRDGE